MSTPVRGSTFPRGVHPPEHKALAADRPIEVLPAPKQVAVPVLQHIGAPSRFVVKPRAQVAARDVLAEPGGFVSAAAHTPIAGKVGREGVVTLPNGRHLGVLPVAADGEQLDPEVLRAELIWADCPLEGHGERDPDEILEAIRRAGIVGQGGAAFPTHVKLKQNPERPVDTLLVNGSECEPYLCADDRLMREAPRPIVAGALLAARAAGAERIILAVEDNKPEALASLRSAAEGTGAVVAGLRTKYPQGGEKQLIYALLRREVPTLGLPLDVGVVVVNVGTAAAIAQAVLRGYPLTHRVVSVTGGGIAEPKNVLAPIGCSYADLIGFCGGLRPEAARVIAGGPMMGFALGQLDVPVTKGTSGVTVLTGEDVQRSEETACVRCGRCVDVCPLNLVPTKIALAARRKQWDLARRYHLQACMECGCCAYQCPARIPLVQLIRMGKVQLPKEKG